ncbi:AEC family transporter [Aliiroseovarius sp. KMU-50]|uniref:AEC family transporter n=1 Tax=Aliiroseovarius salicola TaxID=3009082 RepID=A0ABT4VYN8_9RHOB|nr:AEC family transporter [Aliiroseovarius sp. KMU-50]MDA5093376.1 AEC family transporter [Aliiroseovarius sp. KMU-50]
MDLALAILPILLTLLTGYGLVATGMIPKEHWPAIETLSFRLLIPVILLRIISKVDFGAASVGPFALTLISTVSLAALAVLGLRLLSQSALPNPGFTTLFQTTTRWNGFVGLAAAELFLGVEGTALIALAMAVLVAPLNVVNVAVLSSFGPNKVSAGRVALNILKNPLVQGGALGLALNLGGVALPKPIDDTLELIGRAGLGVGILAIGAGISFKRLLLPHWHTILGFALRPGLICMIFLAIAPIFALTPEQMLAGIFVFGVSCATNGYVVARQMGGDADLYADVMTWQTVLSLVFLPAMAIWLLQ